MARKFQEIQHPDSCLNKAKADEPIFVLRSKDPTAAAVVRFWIQERIRIGKNRPDDPKLIEAEAAAKQMEEYKG